MFLIACSTSASVKVLITTEKFTAGFHCAQAVLFAFSDDLTPFRKPARVRTVSRCSQSLGRLLPLCLQRDGKSA
jgi:hypothetical protein